jgi:hypothetical protein
MDFPGCNTRTGACSLPAAVALATTIVAARQTLSTSSGEQ